MGEEGVLPQGWEPPEAFSRGGPQTGLRSQKSTPAVRGERVGRASGASGRAGEAAALRSPWADELGIHLSLTFPG